MNLQAGSRPLRRRPKPKEDLQKAVSLVAHRLTVQLAAFRRQLRKLQQKAKDQRDARRDARQKSHGAKQSGGRTSFL